MTRTMQLTIAAILLATFALPAAAQRAEPVMPAVSSERSSEQGDAQTRDGIAKMRAILNQMRTNLAFVGSTTTPLAHQFQLDIDMWQALLDQMERREERKAEKADPR